jgi:HAD superfamily hydrolase (TIGR01549 family)
MNKIKAIFYDFDGVIKESTSVKTDAFYKLYLPFGKDIADKVVSHHLQHGGVSRFEKFKIYHKNFLGQELSQEEIFMWAEKFSALVLKSVIESPYVEGAKESIKLLSNTLQQFIITGTPQAEINYIVKELGLSNYFVKIAGSPKNKINWGTELLGEFNLRKENVLFIGDALTDYEAAKHHGFSFILRSHEENLVFFNEINVLKVKNLVDLATVINQDII